MQYILTEQELNKGFEIEKKENSNGGFIDIANFIKEDIFKNGINKNLNEHDLNRIIYNITKTIWENDVCLKANLKESVDYYKNNISTQQPLCQQP